MNDWQSWAAPAVVLVTALFFLVSALKGRKKGGCGGSCGCSHKPK
ncbi:MAG TPA: hypothetical protein DCP71_06775 [Verrucomicrobiales bacterium]|nr:hypothetical protein [Verrucomicrobiales bacterium]